jgi:hypothetical protein
VHLEDLRQALTEREARLEHRLSNERVEEGGLADPRVPNHERALIRAFRASGDLATAHTQNVSGVTNTSASVFMIGAFNLLGTPNYHFNGRIAFVKIYNRALTATEILQNYHAAKGRYK